MNTVFLLLIALQIKHWYIDFVNQSAEEVRCKGIYGHWTGLGHSIKHGLATAIVLLPFATLPGVVLLALVDFLTHYHVDWAKMTFGNRDVHSPEFWNHLGLDQMAHQITYLFIAYCVT